MRRRDAAENSAIPSESRAFFLRQPKHLNVAARVAFENPSASPIIASQPSEPLVVKGVRVPLRIKNLPIRPI